MGRNALESAKIMLTIPEAWTREIDMLVKLGYGKNRQAIIKEWIRDQVVPLMQVKKKGEEQTQ